MLRSRPTLLAALAAFALAVPALPAFPDGTQSDAPPPIKRIPLQRFDVPDTNYETVIGAAELAPDVLIGRHTHPGPESGYAIHGDFTLLIDGQEPRVIHEGESYMVPAGVIHDAKSGAEGARVIATYVVPKGQPLASPAP